MLYIEWIWWQVWTWGRFVVASNRCQVGAQELMLTVLYCADHCSAYLRSFIHIRNIKSQVSVSICIQFKALPRNWIALLGWDAEAAPLLLGFSQAMFKVRIMQ